MPAPSISSGSVASLAFLGEESSFALFAAVVALAAAAIALWSISRRTRDLPRIARRLDALEEIRSHLARIAGERSDIDLRRLEHLLVDLRDGLKRMEDAVLHAVEQSRSGNEGFEMRAPAGLIERVTNRLLSLGYERIQVLTGAEELSEIEISEGEVRFEAHRLGVLHKGRVVVRDGRIGEVDVRPAYSLFP